MEVRLDDNKIHIFGARHTNVTGLNARLARDQPWPWPALAVELESSCRRLRPKNRGPDQRAPVIFRATIVRERYRWPRHSTPSAWMRTIWVTPRHSRTSRVPGLKEIGCTGLAAPRLCGSALACSSFRAVARERPPYARS